MRQVVYNFYSPPNHSCSYFGSIVRRKQKGEHTDITNAKQIDERPLVPLRRIIRRGNGAQL